MKNPSMHKSVGTKHRWLPTLSKNIGAFAESPDADEKHREKRVTDFSFYCSVIISNNGISKALFEKKKKKIF